MNETVSRGARRMLWALGALALSCSAHAQQSPLGMTIATRGTAKGIPACISCHGAQGEGNAAAGFPRLAGVGAAYLEEQLEAFADGRRSSTVMQPFAKIMSLDGRVAVAQYFSQLPPPAGIRTHDPTSPSAADTGAWLATRGRWDEGLPACAQCHGPGGAGVGTAFPPLAGQPAAYIEAQLHAWQTGARPPGPLALMPMVVSKLSDADIHAVAAYYAQQGGDADQEAHPNAR
jgi:cytochrome c553